VRSLSECSKGPERSRRILSPSDSLAEQAGLELFYLHLILKEKLTDA